MTRYATLAVDTHALMPNGRGGTIPAGRYEVADLDGVGPDVLYLCDRLSPGTLIGCVQAADATIEEKP